MNIFNELPTAFPWYDSLKKQDRYKENVAGGKVGSYGVITPRNALLPFQFWKPVNSDIMTWTIYTLGGTLAATVTSGSFSAVKKITLEGRTYFYYNGQPITTTSGTLNLAGGLYYSRISFADGISYYSEIFNVPGCSFLASDVVAVEFLKLEWWNETDLRPIFYNDFAGNVPYFKNVVYLDTFVHVSDPEIIEDGEKDGNDEVIPTFTKALLRYRITDLVPDYLKIALVLMQMHDHVILTTRKGLRTGEVPKLSTNTTTEYFGALSTVEILFEESILIKKGCGDNMGVTISVPVEINFDTELTFEADTSDSAESVGGTVTATNANIKFEFNKKTGLTGTPASMTIKVSAVTQIVVDFLSDYTGAAFRFTDVLGVARLGTFTNGTVNF